jgi:hypothetical protein
MNHTNMRFSFSNQESPCACLAAVASYLGGGKATFGYSGHELSAHALKLVNRSERP